MNRRTFLRSLFVPFFFVASVGCGANMPAPAAAPSPGEMAGLPPPVIDRSLFTRGTGEVSETDLQKLLEGTVEFSFPDRLGVVVLKESFAAENGAEPMDQRLVADELTGNLKGSSHFSLVTDVTTMLPSPRGLEGLRTIAARYRLRYLLLANVVREDNTHLNNWAWLYATGVGAFLAPGVTRRTDGIVQASLFDVKTGTVLFTSGEPFVAERTTWIIGGGRDLRSEERGVLEGAAKKLGRTVLDQTDALARWEEDRKKHG